MLRKTESSGAVSFLQELRSPGVEPAELLEVAENREVFQFLGLLLPGPSSEKKQV